VNADTTIDLGACLVTGAGSAVGNTLVRELLRLGMPVRALGDAGGQPIPDGVEWVDGESCDPVDWEKACAGVTTVFDCAHAACAVSDGEGRAALSPDGPEPDELLRACRSAGVARIIHASGDGGCMGEARIAAEAGLRNAAGDGLAICAVRSGRIWGAGDDDLLGQLVELTARGWYVARPPEGAARCELTSVDRLAQGMLLAADRLRGLRGLTGLRDSQPGPGPVWTLTDGPAVDPLEHFEPVLRDLGFAPPRRRISALWLIAWASLWSLLHRLRLATAPPARASFWRGLTRSRLEDPGTIAAAQRDLALDPNLDGTLDRQAAFEHAERVLERWEAARRERIASSWSLPFFIRLPNVRRTLAAITRAHRWFYLATAGRIGHVIGATTFLLVCNVGRRSGREFLTPLLYVADAGRFVIAASNAGDARTPAWWLNLQARPETIVHAGNRRIHVRARRASPDEAKCLWPRMLASYRWFQDYHAKAGREIPLVILEPIRVQQDA